MPAPSSIPVFIKSSSRFPEIEDSGHTGGKLPEDTEIAFERDKETNRVLNAFLVSTTADRTSHGGSYRIVPIRI